jgi:hypothetical protein
MANEQQINRADETREPRAEVCKASIRLSATLSLATVIGVAVVAFLVWQLLS